MATSEIVEAPTNRSAGVAKAVRIEDLRKEFRRPDGTVVAAVDGVTLTVTPGEFCVLLGPSGCGKTTLLRAVAGLEDPDSGSISFSDEVVYSSTDRTNVATRNRDVGMVFQDYALWPHMKVSHNVGFPLRMRRRGGSSKAARSAHVRDALQAVGIEQLGDSAVSDLSGGQQQRVALARAIVSGSPIILFDEPLSNVDAKVRIQLRAEIKRLQVERGFTALYVTHDQEEAMELADRIVVLRDGRIEQHGTPLDIYREPVSAYVADFIGSADLVDGEVERATEGTVVVATRLGRIAAAHRGQHRVGDEVRVCLRPEDWQISRATGEVLPTGENTWIGDVERVVHLGSVTDLQVSLGDGAPLRIRTNGHSAPVVGERVHLSIAADRCRAVVR